MARRMDGIESAGTDDGRERRIARSTARAFAAAISALLVTTFVVNRTSGAVEKEGTAAANNFVAGTITLADDDQSRSLFDLDAMAPGRPAVECLEVTYTGSILPAEVSLVPDTQGDLAPWLNVTIEQGSGAGFGACEGFEPERTVFDGSLEALADTGSTPLARVLNSGDSFSFRFTFEMADEQEALGRSARADFVWEAVPE